MAKSIFFALVLFYNHEICVCSFGPAVVFAVKGITLL